MQIICVALCVGIEIILAGYPIKMCFDYCQTVEITEAITAYLLFSTILFLPAYYAAYRYSNWHHNLISIASQA